MTNLLNIGTMVDSYPQVVDNLGYIRVGYPQVIHRLSTGICRVFVKLDKNTFKNASKIATNFWRGYKRIPISPYITI